jgi:tetratricopeptide (TPR) repeat protein/O-antigen ligase
MLVAMQLVPLPADVVEFISPHTFALKSRLLSDLPGASGPPEWMTLSFYPLATRAALRTVLVAIVVFIAVIHVFNRTSHIKQLLMVVTLVGGGAALLAVAQDLSRANAIYWAVPRENYLATAGPFVNYNNYAQFANLSLGAALGLMLARLTEAQRRDPLPSGHLLAPMVRLELGRLRWLTGLIVLMAVSIFLSRSRGGMIALMSATAVTAIACAASRKVAGRGWVPMALGLLVLIALLYVGLDAVIGRLATLQQAQVAAKARIELTRDVWHGLIPNFPLLGTGLGTHEVVYPMVSHQTFHGLAGNVEDEYVQVLEETGIVGLILVLSFAAMMALCWVRAVRGLHRPVRSAAFGIGFALIAVMIQSATDFGQRVPAVAVLTAALCGLLVSLARRTRVHDGAIEPAFTRPPMPALAWGTCAVALLIGGWCLVGSARGALGEWKWEKALVVEKELAADRWQGSDEQFASLLLPADAAARWEPDNVTYHHWLNVYRWYAVAAPDPKTGQMVIDDQALAYAKRIVAELHQARATCPTYGPAYSVAGQIELFYLDDPIGEKHINTGYELDQCNPQTCLVAASLDARKGRWDDAKIKLERSLVLGQPLEDVLDVCLTQADRPNLALELTRGTRNPNGLLRLVDLLRQSGKHADVAAEARAQALVMLKDQAADPTATPWTLASAARLLGEDKDFATAAEFYRRALVAEYGRADWHLSLAQVLAQAGNFEEATREAKLCLRLDPGMTAARQLLDDLAVSPKASR